MKTSQLNPGRSGAKRQSWSKSNPRDVLRDVIHSNPRASEKETRDDVWELIKDDDSYFEVLFDYWFANNYRCFFVDEVASGETKRKTKPEDRVVKTSITSTQITREEIEKVKSEMRPILMDHLLSTGSLLKNSTFKDCEKEGGWLKEVSKHGKPSEVIGKHLKEKDIFNLRKRFFGE